MPVVLDADVVTDVDEEELAGKDVEVDPALADEAVEKGESTIAPPVLQFT